MAASPDQGWYRCILQNPLCPLAQGDSEGQNSLEPEAPTDTVWVASSDVGPIQSTAFRLDSTITLTSTVAVAWTFEVLLVSLWKGRIRVARGRRILTSPTDAPSLLVSWFSGPSPITERWLITTTVTPDVDPGAGRASIKYNLVVGCLPIGSNIYYGEEVTALPLAGP